MRGTPTRVQSLLSTLMRGRSCAYPQVIDMNMTRIQNHLAREAHIIDDRPLPSDRHGLDFIIPVQYEDRVGDRRRAREGEVQGGGAVTESDNHSTRSGGSGRARNHSDRLRSSQKTSDHVSGPI